MKNKIRLDTMSDINNFCTAVSKVNCDVYLVDTEHRYKVNAKSQLSCMLAGAEWSSISVECEEDIYQLISEWVII